MVRGRGALDSAFGHADGTQIPGEPFAGNYAGFVVLGGPQRSRFVALTLLTINGPCGSCSNAPMDPAILCCLCEPPVKEIPSVFIWNLSVVAKDAKKDLTLVNISISGGLTRGGLGKSISRLRTSVSVIFCKNSAWSAAYFRG